MKTSSSSVFVGAALVILAACATQNRDVAASGGDAGADAPAGCAQDCSKVVAASCFEGRCNELSGQCEIVTSADGTGCDDGLFCTVGETCHQGACGNGKPNLCGQTDCLEGICNEQAHQCMLTPRADQTPCTVHGDACAAGATCQSGVCVTTPKDCSYAPGIDECHTATCNPATGTCEVVAGNDGAACHAQYNCWVDQTCWKGVCQGGYSVDHWAYSKDTTACHENVCNPNDGSFTEATVPVGAPCDLSSGSGYECTTGTCAQGNKCVAVPKIGASCASVQDDCSFGTCDQEAHCAPSPTSEGAACDDRDVCTTGATCQQGSCKGSPKSGVTVYFKDDFGSGSLGGWQRELGATSPWSVHPALAVDQQPPRPSGGVTYYQPEKDHTATMDQEMLANANGAIGDFVDSPAIDLSAATGSVWLTAWIVGQTQADKELSVGIFDGTRWSDVWVTALDESVTQWAWTPIVVDVTNYKNANFKVRFGFEIGPNPPGSVPSIPIFAIDGLFVDDVTLSSQPCAPGTGASGGGGGGGNGG